MKRYPPGPTGQREVPSCKRLIYKAFGLRELQRARRWLQSRSKTLQLTRRVKVFQSFTWIAGATEAGYYKNKRGIEE